MNPYMLRIVTTETRILSLNNKRIGSSFKAIQHQILRQLCNHELQQNKATYCTRTGNVSQNSIDSTTPIPQTSHVSSEHTRRFSTNRHRKSNRRAKNDANKNNGKKFQLDALPFSVSPDQALSQFYQWANEEQGLSYLLRWNSNTVKIQASYVPVWSFDINVRFARTSNNTSGSDPKKQMIRYDWKPAPFDLSHVNQSVVHLPGISAYAGYSYRRSLIDPIHNLSLIFMGDQKVPFQSWMLRDIYSEQTGERMDVFPDPWNATNKRAFIAVRDELKSMVEMSSDTFPPDTIDVQVQTEILSSRRVYMPTYVIDYSILGLEYRAFISGCDSASGVSGVSHQVLPAFMSQNMKNISHQDLSNAFNMARNFLSGVSNVAMAASRGLGRGTLASATVFVLKLVGNVAARVLVRLPLVSLLGGVFVGFRKIIKPWMDNRTASAEWERQRDHESYAGVESSLDYNDFHYVDDFTDFEDRARTYFQQNKTRILEQWNGANVHEEGDFDWYTNWEKWSKHHWEEQQQQQQQNYQNHRQQQRQQQRQRQRQQTRNTERKSKPEYVWDFDPNDPYSVLGIRRGASASEVSAAFRKEMLKHHPDVQAGGTQAEKDKSVERSKYISEAYRKIKMELKK